MKCSDPECGKQATRELLGVQMCEAYYIEALDHSAHIVANKYLAEWVEDFRHDRLQREQKVAAWEARKNKHQAWLEAYLAKRKAKAVQP